MIAYNLEKSAIFEKQFGLKATKAFWVMYSIHTSYWHTHTHTHLKALFSGTTRVSRYQKGKTNLDFTESRDSEWQWHQLGCMQVCTSLQTDNHASTTPPLSVLQCHGVSSGGFGNVVISAFV